MKKILTLFLLVVAIIFLLLAGCKIKITVPEGGNVITESGSYGCVSERECTIDIYDIYFDETFVAEPDQGYVYIEWKRKDKGLCGLRAPIAAILPVGCTSKRRCGLV